MSADFDSRADPEWKTTSFISQRTDGIIPLPPLFYSFIKLLSIGLIHRSNQLTYIPHLQVNISTMKKRKALHSLPPNTLFARRRSLPRPFEGLDPSLRTRKFGSTSKTPRISNCATGFDTKEERDEQTNPSAAGNATANRHVTSRQDRKTNKTKKKQSPRNKSHRRPRDAERAVLPSVQYQEVIPPHRPRAKSQERARVNNIAMMNAFSRNRLAADIFSERLFGRPQSPDEDMELSSGGSVDLSASTPEESPPSPSGVPFQQTPAAAVASSSSVQIFSPKMTRNHRAFATTRSNPVEQPSHPQLTGDYLRSVRDAPADDPAVLAQILYGGNTLVGVEVGGDEQQGSLAGSELTASTLEQPSLKAAAPVVALMPSFQPSQSPDSNMESRDIAHGDDFDEYDDMVEEWSLPDEEANTAVEFELEGKHYIHNPLPPGWKIQISKSHKRPFYVHPDHAPTWHCPVFLKPKSEALRFRRSSIGANKNRALNPTPRSKNRKRDHMSPDHYQAPLPTGETMSDVIKRCKDIGDGYEGSVSSNWSTDGSTFASSKESTGCPRTDDCVPSDDVPTVGPEHASDWETPLRCDMTTPTPKRRRRAAAKKSSTPKLSPIAEYIVDHVGVENDPRKESDDSPPPDNSREQRVSLAAPPFADAEDYVASASERSQTTSVCEERRSTPRVSFEPREVRIEMMPLLVQHSDTFVAKQACPRSFSPRLLSETKPAAFQSPSAQPSAEASTPISDGDATEEDVQKDTNRVEVVEVGSSRHASHIKGKGNQVPSEIFTPKEMPAMVASSFQVAPIKRKNFLSASILRKSPPGTLPGPAEEQASDPSPSHSGSTTVSEHTPRPHATEKAKSNKATKVGSSAPPKVLSESAQSSGGRHLTSLKPTKPGQHGTLKLYLPNSTETPSDEQSALCNHLEGSTVEQMANNSGSGFSPSSASYDFGATNNDSSLENSPEDLSPTMMLHAKESNHISSPISQGFVSQPLHEKHSVKTISTVPSQITFDAAASSGVSIEALPVDEGELEALVSPPPPKRNNRAYNWRVLCPLYPLCSLQRLDVLLEAQRKRKRKAPQASGKARANLKGRSKPKKKQNPRVYRTPGAKKRSYPRRKKRVSI